MRWSDLRVGDVVVDHLASNMFVLLEADCGMARWLSLHDAREMLMTASDAEILEWELIKGPAWGEE